MDDLLMKILGKISQEPDPEESKDEQGFEPTEEFMRFEYLQ